MSDQETTMAVLCEALCLPHASTLEQILARVEFIVDAEAQVVAERDGLAAALEHAKTTIGLAVSFIPADRFQEFFNRRAALAGVTEEKP